MNTVVLRPKRTRSTKVLFVFFGLALGSAFFSDASWSALSDDHGLQIVRRLLSGLLHPDLSKATLVRVGALVAQSIAIGFSGTALALLLAIPVAVWLARPPASRIQEQSSGLLFQLSRQVSFATRGILSLFRTLPEVLLATLLVGLMGLGPGAAVLAIALSFAGIFGKVLTELLEAAPPEAELSLRAEGTSPRRARFFSSLPWVQIKWGAYALFRLEFGVRSAAVLGVVGAGGLGTEIALAIRYLQMEKLATCLLALLVAVVLLEHSSRWLLEHHPRLALPILLGGGLGCLPFLQVDWSVLFTSSTWNMARDLLQTLLQPRLDFSFWKNAVLLLTETLAMAVFATLLAALIAFFASPFAALTTSFVPSFFSRLLRILFAGNRAFPELLLALLFLLWVGPGPFAGALAIATHNLGVLGRLFADAIDETEAQSAAFLEQEGSSALGQFLFARLPRALPRMLIYVFYRFEVNVRMTTVVGFVGAGGFGDALHTAVVLFRSQDLSALLLLLWVTVVVVDRLSAFAGLRLRQETY